MKIRNSETEKNLLKAFVGESQARNRYTYYAEKAHKDGFIIIARLFENISAQEKEHAKLFLNFLEEGILEIQTSFLVKNMGSTLENLRTAASGENKEYSELYFLFADIARKEKFSVIAELFDNISVAERDHEKQYKYFIEQLSSNLIFRREDIVTWKCLNCGYLHSSKVAPELCPVCKHHQGYFTSNQF
ncbi:MAG: rubrerythrin family protein [Coxiellaceae bacterium]|jgi:rubrerythrin|nr:rubrerythrin family protein [Coxiellaceae bacterium]